MIATFIWCQCYKNICYYFESVYVKWIPSKCYITCPKWYLLMIATFICYQCYSNQFMANGFPVNVTYYVQNEFCLWLLRLFDVIVEQTFVILLIQFMSNGFPVIVTYRVQNDICFWLPRFLAVNIKQTFASISKMSKMNFAYDCYVSLLSILNKHLQVTN